MLEVKFLDNRIRAVNVPIDGIAKENDSYRVDFKPEATQEQRDQAAAIVAAFDSVAEVAAYEATVQTERGDLSDLLPKIATELNYIDTTLIAIDTMTTAQVRDVVKRILQEQQVELRAWRYVIRQLVG